MQERNIGRNSPCPCGSRKKYKHCCATLVAIGEVEVLHEQAIAHCRRGRFAEATKLFKRVLESQPDSAETWLNLGNAFKELDEVDQAIECYRRVVALKPELPVAHYNLGVALQGAGRPDAAIESYRAALAIQPDDAEARYNLGVTLDVQGHEQDAVSCYEKTLELKPGHASASFNLAVLLAKLGRADEAISRYQQTLRAQPAAFDALTNLADLYAKLGRDDEAREYYERALQLRPSLARAQLGLGRMHKRHGDLERARTCLQSAIEIEPELVDAQLSLGLTLIELGKLPDAVSPLHNARKLSRALGVSEPKSSPNFAKTSRSKLRHDVEQLEYLVEKRKIPPSYAMVAARYRQLLESLRGELDKSHLADLFPDDLRDLGLVYNRFVNFYDAPRAAAAINPDLDARAIEDSYRANAPGIAYVDNFLSTEALDALRRFCLESTIWHNFKYPNGYLGASIDDGFYCPLLAQIAEELPRALPGIFKHHALTHLWAFKYDGSMTGIGVHADFAAVNVNFWITPDSANRSVDSGGLVVWDKEAPADWDFDAYNNDRERIDEFLHESSAKATRIPYRENRAVVFNSDLFHKTDEIDFAEGYENRRINVTLLYGVRERA